MQCRVSDKIVSNDYLDYITDYALDDVALNLDVQDFCYLPVSDRYRVNYIKRDGLPALRVADYYYYSIPKLYGLQELPMRELESRPTGFNTLNLVDTGIYQTQQPPLALTGNGVLIGIIDTGIRYTEDVFKDAFGNTRIEAIWDQTIDNPERAPDGFFYGSEYLREDINAALASATPREVVPSWDENGHGTIMASIAAGSNLGENTFIGAAPDATLCIVKLKQAKQYLRDYYLVNENADAFQENDIMLACKYLLQYARTFQRPLVILLGVGTNMGDHAGSSPLGGYLSRINSERNVAVVVAGGNEGNANHHYLGNLSQAGDSDFGGASANLSGQEVYENVEIRVGEGEKGFVCELWGLGADVFEVGITSPGGERIPRISFNYQEGLSYDFVYEDTRIDIDIVLVEELSSQELIFMRFIDPTPGVWTISVYNQGEVRNGVFHMWLPIAQFLSANTYFLSPNPYTTITEPAMAAGLFTVGAYDVTSGAFAFYSGRGNNRVGFPKPDLLAPGVMIYTILGVSSGTSIAASYVAGAVAQFLEWAVVERNAVLVSGTGIRGYFVLGARRDLDLPYPNRELGYGKLDLQGVFNELRR